MVEGTTWGLAIELLVRMIMKQIRIVLCLELQVPFHFPHDKNPRFDVANTALQRGSRPLSPALPPSTLPLASCTPATLDHHRPPAQAHLL